MLDKRGPREPLDIWLAHCLTGPYRRTLLEQAFSAPCDEHNVSAALWPTSLATNESRISVAVDIASLLEDL